MRPFYYLAEDGWKRLVSPLQFKRLLDAGDVLASTLVRYDDTEPEHPACLHEATSSLFTEDGPTIDDPFRTEADIREEARRELEEQVRADNLKKQIEDEQKAAAINEKHRLEKEALERELQKQKALTQEQKDLARYAAAKAVKEKADKEAAIAAAAAAVEAERQRRAIEDAARLAREGRGKRKSQKKTGGRGISPFLTFIVLALAAGAWWMSNASQGAAWQAAYSTARQELKGAPDWNGVGLASIERGAQIEVRPDPSAGAWTKARVGGQEGYIGSQHFSATPPPALLREVHAIWRLANGANLRSEPRQVDGDGDNKVGALPAGAAIYVVGVVPGGRIGWVEIMRDDGEDRGKRSIAYVSCTLVVEPCASGGEDAASPAAEPVRAVKPADTPDAVITRPSPSVPMPEPGAPARRTGPLEYPSVEEPEPVTALDRPRAIPDPRWARVPTDTRMQSVFPKRATRQGVSGTVLLSCIAESSGRLSQCRVASEQPTGWGFGDAALSLTPDLLVETTSKSGETVLGRTIEFYMDFPN